MASEAESKGFHECDPNCTSWINGDDRPEPGVFASAVALFDKFPDVQWLGGRSVFMSEAGCQGTHETTLGSLSWLWN
jgi:hypothetical protein